MFLIIIVPKCTAIHMVFSECTHHSLPRAEHYLDFAKKNRSDCTPIGLFGIYAIILIVSSYSHKLTVRAIAVRFEYGRTVARFGFWYKENDCPTRCNAVYCDSIVIETGKSVRPGCIRFYRNRNL